MVNGWKTKKLGEVAEVCMCKRIFAHQTSKIGDIPFYKIGTFGKEADAYISSQLYEEYKAKYSYPEKGDVLISAAGTLGRTVVFDGRPAYFQDSNIVWLKIDKSQLSNDYLAQYYKVIKWASSEGSTISRLYNGIICDTEILLPPLEEQVAIAEALSDIDSLIFSLQKQIEKKKAIKQGAMQELKKKKKRLPGFSGEWEKNTLKQICEFINGRAYSQHELLSRGKYKVLRLGNLFTNSHWYYTDLELNEKQYCEKGDLLYAWSASFGPTIWDGEKSVFHYHIWKIKCSEMIDKKYLYHFLNADVSSILNELQGGTMFHLTKENMENRLCSYPNLDEQQAIAQVLSDMDCEIEQLEKKLAKYQQIKQGMMQELLTGRIRLV